MTVTFFVAVSIGVILVLLLIVTLSISVFLAFKRLNKKGQFCNSYCEKKYFNLVL